MKVPIHMFLFMFEVHKELLGYIKKNYIEHFILGQTSLCSNDNDSGSALFIKTKNHVRACPLLKPPMYAFYFC